MRKIIPLSAADLDRRGYVYPALLAAFALIGVLGAVDLAADLKEGTTLLHAVVELAVIAVSLVAALVVLRFLLIQLGAAKAEVRSLATRLESSRLESERWRREAQDLLEGLGAAIDRQFSDWGLTSAEKEVALFLLKGLSHKEIAAIRQVSEATARQQARSVYRKAGVGGRRDLAAFFLEDLSLPHSRHQ